MQAKGARPRASRCGGRRISHVQRSTGSPRRRPSQIDRASIPGKARRGNRFGSIHRLRRCADASTHRQGNGEPREKALHNNGKSRASEGAHEVFLAVKSPAGNVPKLLPVQCKADGDQPAPGMLRDGWPSTSPVFSTMAGRSPLLGQRILAVRRS